MPIIVIVNYHLKFWRKKSKVCFYPTAFQVRVLCRSRAMKYLINISLFLSTCFRKYVFNLIKFNLIIRRKYCGCKTWLNLVFYGMSKITIFYLFNMYLYKFSIICLSLVCFFFCIVYIPIVIYNFTLRKISKRYRIT